jgi:hypothetical protein
MFVRIDILYMEVLMAYLGSEVEPQIAVVLYAILHQEWHLAR